MTARSLAHGIVVECLPEMIDALMTRLCACINQNADLRFQLPSDRIEQPSVGVNLLLVLCLYDEDDLHGNEVVRIISVWKHECWSCVDRQLGRVLENMCDDIFPVDLFFHDTVLVNANSLVFCVKEGVCGLSLDTHRQNV